MAGLFDFSWFIPSEFGRSKNSRTRYGSDDEMDFIRDGEGRLGKFLRILEVGVVSAITFTRDLLKPIVQVLVGLNYLLIKLATIVEAVAIIVGNILPLTVTAMLLNLFKVNKNPIYALFDRAGQIAESRIKIAAISAAVVQALDLLQQRGLIRALGTVVGALPVATGVLMATIATIWRPQINSFIYNVGVNLGLMERDYPLEQKLDSDIEYGRLFINREERAALKAARHNKSMAELSGTVVATVAATMFAPAAFMTGVVAPSIIAAAGSMSGAALLMKYRGKGAQNDNQTMDVEQEEQEEQQFLNTDRHRYGNNNV